MEILHRDVSIDANTLPQRKNVRSNSKLFETIAVNLLVEDIMRNPYGETCVVYSYDGSWMSRVGSYLWCSH